MGQLWGKISEEQWASVAYVAGRVATEADVVNGSAVFFINGESAPAAFPLPCRAFQRLDDGAEIPVVVIQAEAGPHGTLLGVRYLDGGNGVCALAEVTLAPSGWRPS
jgi:hypothetical protein